LGAHGGRGPLFLRLAPAITQKSHA
jgi:hypothetical protein